MSKKIDLVKMRGEFAIAAMEIEFAINYTLVGIFNKTNKLPFELILEQLRFDTKYKILKKILTLDECKFIYFHLSTFKIKENEKEITLNLDVLYKKIDEIQTLRNSFVHYPIDFQLKPQKIKKGKDILDLDWRPQYTDVVEIYSPFGAPKYKKIKPEFYNFTELQQIILNSKKIKQVLTYFGIQAHMKEVDLRKPNAFDSLIKKSKI